MSKGNLIGTRRFGSGWEQIADVTESPAVTVLKKPPPPSNVYIKTQNDSGFLRQAGEPRKFDPSELEEAPTRKALRRIAPVRAKAPLAPAKKAAPAKKPAGRDAEHHRAYMREYMRKRRAKKAEPDAV